MKIYYICTDKKLNVMTNDEALIKFKEIFDFAEINQELESIVNIDDLMKAPAAPSADTGVAYEGGLVFHTIMVWHFANKLLPIYKNIAEINAKSLAKVVVLHQLGKIGMFTPNTDDWQVKKLGNVYAFVESGVCLKTGERSKLVCSNAGVTFTPEEYEAMSILDKTAEEYENMAKFRTHLSTVLRMSSDLAFTVARERYKKTA
jgi:hypothetical protein